MIIRVPSGLGTYDHNFVLGSVMIKSLMVLAKGASKPGSVNQGFNWIMYIKKEVVRRERERC